MHFEFRILFKHPKKKKPLYVSQYPDKKSYITYLRSNRKR